MTFKSVIVVDDLAGALKDLRSNGFIAKQSDKEPDYVHVYGKDKDALIEASRRNYKTRGYENTNLGDEFYENLVEDVEVTDEELLAAIKEPEIVGKSVVENKTEGDLYDERHPLDLHGKKYSVSDEDLLEKAKEGDDFRVVLEAIEPSDPAVKVTEAQTQRGGKGNPGEKEAKAKEEEENRDKNEEPSKDDAAVVDESTRLADKQ